ncbi:transglycosylase domain-containing protein [Luedemannella flava]
MRTRDRSLFANAAALLVCGVLAGVVVAAAAFPAIAMGGLAMKSGSDAYGGLPSQLQVLQSPQISYVYASDNKTLLATIYDENRHDIPLAQIPKIMQDAIIAAEDERFYDHHGVDVQGVLRAYVANQNSDDQQGASTLTMQYVRQALTYFSDSPSDIIAATERTNLRKMKEIKYALTLETQLTKEQILERYLNIAAFGNATYGIYAASQVFFGKEPKNLTLGEASLLAGLVKAPSTYDPTTKTGLKNALDRRQYVLSQMVKNGYITQAQSDEANKAQLKIIGKRTPNGCVATRKNDWGFFCDYLYRWWLQQEAFGADTSTRENKLKAGGFRIVTTLDVSVQAAAKKNIEKQLKTGNPIALSLAAIEPGTGKIKAMATNRKYGLDTSGNGPSTDPKKRKLGIKGTYPTTTNPLISGGGDITGYKMGSTFKMFTMVAALEAGYTLDYPIATKSPYQSQYAVESSSRAACKDRKHWCPVNANPKWMNGLRTMWTGFGRSVNTYFVPLQERVGADKVVEVAKRLGMQFRAKGTKDAPADYEFSSDPDRARNWGPFTLGVSDAVPLELANAYATLAADGKYCEPIPVSKITDHAGNVLDEVTKPRCKQAVKADVARAAVDAARCPVGDRSSVSKCDGGTATGVRGIVGKPVMGKTGTSDVNWTATMALSTKQLSIVGTMADPDYAQHDNVGVSMLTNNAVAYTMRDALKGKKSVNFTPPSAKYTTGKRVSIPGNLTCRGVDEVRSILRGRGFIVEVDNNPIDSPCPAGTVASTEPDRWTIEDGYVLIHISNGRGTRPPTQEPGLPGQPGNGGGNGRD